MAKVTFKRAMIALATIVVAMCSMSCSDETLEPTFVGFGDVIYADPSQTLKYEDTRHVAEFDTTACELFTVEQFVEGNLVLYKGTTEVDRASFAYNLNLNATFEANPEVVYVSKKEDLSTVSMTSSTMGEVTTVADTTETGFILTKTSKNYTFNFNEGEEVTANTVYESLSHADTLFAYDSIESLSYKDYDATLDESKSNADSTVYDVNLYFAVKIKCKENSEHNATYMVRVPFKRIYKEAPAEAVTGIKDVEYKVKLDTVANELFTVEQYVKGYFVTTLRDEEVERKMFKYDLNLNAKFTARPQKVYVDSEAKLSNVVLTSSSSDAEVKANETKDEFVLASTSKNYTFKFNEGEEVTAKTVYQSLSTAGTVFAYTEVKNVSYKDYDATLNKTLSNNDEIVYDINLYFDVKIDCKENSSQSKTYVVRVPVQRIYMPEVIETKIENTDYEGEFDTVTKQLFTVMQKVNGDFVTYRNQTEIERESFERDINLEAIFDVPEVVYVETEESLNKVTLEYSSKDGDRVRSRSTDGFTTTARSMNYNFRFNEGENVVSATEYEREAYGSTDFVYSVIQNVRYSTFSASRNDVKSNADSTVFDVVLYFNVEVKREDIVATKSINTKTYSVAVPYSRVLKHEDVMTGKSYRDVRREIISETSERVSFIEYEIWSNSGEKNAREISKVLNFGFSGPSKQTVYTTNINYSTTSNGSVVGGETSTKDGNWTVYTRTNSYSSTADNGHKSFNNKYSYNSQKAVYKNEYYTVEFDYGRWSITEGKSVVEAKSGEKTTEGIVYNVYPYVNNVSYTYDVVSDTYTGAGKSNADICVEKPVERILPPEWGKIIGAGISAVPADDKGGDYAQKCLCIRTDKGAVAVVFDMNTKVPTVESITSGNFVEGNFDSAYNSGVYSNGKWEPAKAEDMKDRIAYFVGDTCMRNVRNTTLSRWNWRDGNFSTKVDGYIFTTTDGTMTVKYNNEVVLRLR